VMTSLDATFNFRRLSPDEDATLVLLVRAKGSCNGLNFTVGASHVSTIFERVESNPLCDSFSMGAH
jgi:hypothetical protein